MANLNLNGRILYEGPSLLDGVPIVVIATGFKSASANSKTGDMIQTWILRQDIPPHVAFRAPEGATVCGDCPHRINGTCYVRWHQAPLAVWNCWKSGAGYPPATPPDFTDVNLRIGSAGDPAAVPVDVWLNILPWVRTHTGYTHQWRHRRFQTFQTFLQASCDSPADLAEARASGWRTFTVLPIGAPDPAGTVHCAASRERGAKTDCATCHLCDGRSAHVVIQAHGIHAARVQPIRELVAA